jgi:hypothetical protein
MVERSLILRTTSMEDHHIAVLSYASQKIIFYGVVDFRCCRAVDHHLPPARFQLSIAFSMIFLWVYNSWCGCGDRYIMITITIAISDSQLNLSIDPLLSCVLLFKSTCWFILALSHANPLSKLAARYTIADSSASIIQQQPHYVPRDEECNERRKTFLSAVDGYVKHRGLLTRYDGRSLCKLFGTGCSYCWTWGCGSDWLNVALILRTTWKEDHHMAVLSYAAQKRIFYGLYGFLSTK